MILSVRAEAESWPIAGSFVISRGARTEAIVVVVEVGDGTHVGRAECVPYAHYGETAESVLAAIRVADLRDGDREALRIHMKAGAARNAIDCALWDYEAKRHGTTAWRRAGLPTMRGVETAYTISLGKPEAMAAAARAASGRPMLKLKLGGDGDPARLRAVRSAAPKARLVADANEAWGEGNFAENMQACVEAGVELIEQPLPADADEMLRSARHGVLVCADESVHVAADLDALAGKYDAINVKLDKAGGLTEAFDLASRARHRGFKVMVGCMVGTSLAMAPAMLLAQEADFVDLDGPLLLARDREPGLVYSDGLVEPPRPELWG
jgi:L-alanine-DL-glutamate epimerase-like enolase superfamily enzyme